MIRFLQTIGVGIQMSFIEMRSHKLRSALSILGVMLGVASLVAMLTLIAGVDVYLNEKMGLWTGSFWFVNRRDADTREKMTWSRSPSLRFSDGKYLEDKSDDVQHFFRIIERNKQVYISGRSIGRTPIRGMDQQSFLEELEETRITEGVALSNNDFVSGNPVCIISWKLAEKVRIKMRFSHEADTTLVGKKCIIDNVIVTISGVYGPKDPEFIPWQVSNTLLMPLVTMQKYVTGYDPSPGSIGIRVFDAENLKTKLLGIIPRLVARHRGVEDFEVHTPDWLEEVTSMLNNAAIMMGIVSIISLLVGGLSIMNVMLSSISERIHEIGVRKALGAKRLQIFVQFTVETITLSGAGGLVGIVFGMAPLLFKDAIQKSTDGSIEPTLFASHLIGVFCIIVFVGIFFGLYPALKAARMNPVDALRYE